MASWIQVPASRDLPSYRFLAPDLLETPQLDDRQYRLLDLQNGLRAVLVHDPQSDKAAASLALTIGYMHDPIDAPGMAHFCEHMITKGSDLYPAENDYISFITTNGGSRNASTGALTTDFWFSLDPANDKVRGGLARLAAFACAPRFAPELAAREIRAVDAEFRRNLQNDGRRVLQLVRHLSVPGHPWAKFSTGCYASLTEAARQRREHSADGPGDGGAAEEDEETVLREMRRRLVEWWENQYCASRMALAVVSRDSLDEMTAMVVPSFSMVPSRGLDPRPAIKDPAWGPEQMGTVVFVQTVKDYYGFSLQFELPDLRAHHASKPGSFLAHFLGHEGPGSVCALLKKRGWLLDLSAGVSGDSRGVQLFKVEGTLTLQGYLNYTRALEIVFEYISLLRRSFPLEPHHYAEVACMAQTRFRFMQKVQPHTYAVRLARECGEPYPPERLLSGAHLYRERDEGAVRQVVDRFLPERARVLLLARDHRADVVGHDVRWETERWYGTRYAVRRLEEAFLSQLREPSGSGALLFLPGPNPFIPTDLSVERVDVSEPAKRPTLVARNGRAQLWHKKDDQFWVPKAHVEIIVKSPLAYASARHAAMTRLFVDLVEDALAEVTYAADLAGLTYAVSCHDDGITVSIGGYSDKLDVLLRVVLSEIRGLSVSADRLSVLKEKVQRVYENYYIGQPSDLSGTHARWLLKPIVWTPADKLPELDLIGVGDIERHREDLLSKAVIEILVDGNITRERSIGILGITEECLRPRPLLPSEVPAPRSLVIPPGSNVVLRKHHANPEEVNSSLSYHCQFGSSANARLRNVAALIHHIIREPVFSTLRTREQLGYVVHSTLWSVNHSTFGLGITVQSTQAPWFVEGRVEAFLETFRAQLAGLTDAQFATHKEGLVVKTLVRVKNLGEESARFWDRIRAGHYDFLRNETDAATIRTLTLQEVVAAYDTLVCPSLGAQTRKKLSVQLISQQLREEPPPLPLPLPVPGSAPSETQVQVVRGLARGPSDGDGQEVQPQQGGVVVVAIVDEDGGAAVSAFKAALGCASAARPVVSDAFGEYDGLFPGPDTDK